MPIGCELGSCGTTVSVGVTLLFALPVESGHFGIEPPLGGSENGPAGRFGHVVCRREGLACKQKKHSGLRVLCHMLI